MNTAVLLEALSRRVQWEFSRSGGPGGQHLNSSSTKALLRLPLAPFLADELGLTPELCALAADRLVGRLNNRGELIIASSEHRSQTQNRQAALSRAAALIQGALQTPRHRRPTRPGRRAREKRMEAKHHRSRLKEQRRRPLHRED